MALTKTGSIIIIMVCTKLLSKGNTLSSLIIIIIIFKVVNGHYRNLRIGWAGDNVTGAVTGVLTTTVIPLYLCCIFANCIHI